MKQIFVALLVVCGANAQAQDEEVKTSTNTYNHAVKLYTVGRFNPYSDVYIRNRDSYAVQTSISDYIQPSLAVSFRNKKHNYHELELSRVSVRSTSVNPMIQTSQVSLPSGYRLNTANFAMRYEFIVPFIKRKQALFVPAVGAAVMPYYSRYSLQPYSPADVPVTSSTLGAQTFIIPRLQVNISKRIFIDANVPVCIIDFGTKRNHIQDPTLPVTARQYTIADVQFLPGVYTARLGVGVRL
ncbi:MAG TPA: hypothetical protein VIN07_02360 [Flavipsychrobacter sp.]